MSDLGIHPHLSHDIDPEETAEWQQSLASLLQAAGPQRVRQIMDMLAATAREPAIGWQPALGTPYVNTIPVDRQPPFPGDLAIEERADALEGILGARAVGAEVPPQEDEVHRRRAQALQDAVVQLAHQGAGVGEGECRCRGTCVVHRHGASRRRRPVLKEYR